MDENIQQVTVYLREGSVEDYADVDIELIPGSHVLHIVDTKGQWAVGYPLDQVRRWETALIDPV